MIGLAMGEWAQEGWKAAKKIPTELLPATGSRATWCECSVEQCADRRCAQAGIKVIMVTGDHPRTAVAIARQIGLVTSAQPEVITGDQIRQLSGAGLQLALDAPEIVFARVGADQKMREMREVVRAEVRGVRRPRGGSGITQQLVKNLFLRPGRSYVRKALEFPLALWVDLVIPQR